MRFELVGGAIASGKLRHMERRGGDLVYVTGELAEPEPGRFFFQRQTRPGVAGGFVGVVEFARSPWAYRIEPTGPGGGPELIERPLSRVRCLKLPLPQDGGTNQTEQVPPLNPAAFPTLPIPPYQNGIIRLESLNGAKPVIYLDFQGGYTPAWGGVTYARPQVSNDQIRDVWVRVAGHFLAFNLNVTTDLRVYQNASEGSRQRVVITPTTTAAPDAGGVAYEYSFNWTGDTPCWVFSTVGEACAAACAHEIGHTLGLSHEGQIINNARVEYYAGQGSGLTGWAPIMGLPFNQNVIQWSKGEHLYADNLEDQLAIITTQNNDVAYRPDDTGDTLAGSRYLELYAGYTAGAEGLIERTADADAFQFSTAGGALQLRADPVSTSPPLALQVMLYDAQGELVASNNPQDTLWAALSTNLPAGAYTFCVGGAGRNSPLTNGFSDYASLGYYSVTGSVANARLPDRFAILEHSTNGAVVGVVTANNPNTDPLAYAITAGNAGNTFAIDNTGTLTVANNGLLDYATLASQTRFTVQLELFVDIDDLLNDTLSETNRRVVIAILPSPQAPAITGQPESLVAPAGASAAFEVTAAGDEPLDPLIYQWFWNGAPIPAATTSTLLLPDAQSWQAGDYLVTVTNSLGAVTSAVATLFVTPALPIFTQQPRSQGLFPGATASFLPSTQGGSEPITYQWEFDGADLAGQTNAPLVLTDAQLPNVGSYQLIVANPAGTLTSQLALLSIVPLAAWGWDAFGQADVPLDTTNIVQISAGAEHSLALKRDGSVIAWGGGESTNVPPALTNATSVAAGGSHSLALTSDGSITLWGAGGTNASVYPQLGQLVLPAGLPGVSAVSGGAAHTLALVGDGAPFITAPLVSRAGNGPRAIFGTAATGVLPLSYQWQFNGIELPGATSPALVLGFAGAGVYRVTVTNSIGVATSADATLTYPDQRPAVVTQPVSHTGYLGNQVRFGVTATGAMPLSYQWYFQAAPIPGATNWMLTLEHFLPRQCGPYFVVVSNGLGVATSALASLDLGQVVAWGGDCCGQTNVPAGLTDVLRVAGGGYNSLALRADGTVVVWGGSPFGDFGQCTVPAGLSNAIAIAAGSFHDLALLSDGTVRAWGAGSSDSAPGDCNIPPDYGQSQVPAGLSNVVDIAAGSLHSVALKRDGQVVVWGGDSTTPTNVPPSATNLVAIASSGCSIVALKGDGSLVGWGQSAALPLTCNAVGVAAASTLPWVCFPDWIGSVVLESDGTVIAPPNIGSRSLPMPVGLSNVIQIAAGPDQYLALKDDGTIVRWGPTDVSSSTEFPAGLTNVIDIACGGSHGLAALGDGSVRIKAPPPNRTVYLGDQTLLTVMAAGTPPVSFQWQFNGTDLPGGTSAWLRLTNVQPANAGSYRVIVSNIFGALTSQAADLAVVVSLAPALNATSLPWLTPGDAAWESQTNFTHDGLAAAQSGAISAGQESTLQTTVSGPGVLGFWWKVSSGTNSGLFTFSIDAVTNAVISGEVDWRLETFSVPVGLHTLKWTYAKSASAPGAGLDAAWLDQVSFTTNAPVIVQQPAGATIGAGGTANLTVVVSGAAPLGYQWELEGTNLAGATASSLRLSNVTRRSSGVYAVAVSNPGGIIVSSNATVEVLVPQKLEIPVWGPNGAFTALSRDVDGGVLELGDLPGFEARASTNLVDWTTLTNSLLLTNGSLLLLDPAAANHPSRFYRIRERVPAP